MTYAYTYIDPYGYKLAIAPSATENGDVQIVANDVDAPAEDLPEIVAALYRAAEQEPPVLLPRYPINPSQVAEGRVPVPYTMLRPVSSPTGATVDQVRDLASYLGSAADVADPPPHLDATRQDHDLKAAREQLVEALAAEGWADHADGIARVVLAAGYRPRMEGGAR